MTKKASYTAPEADLLVIAFEGNFCTTGKPGEAGGNDEIVEEEFN